MEPDQDRGNRPGDVTRLLTALAGGRRESLDELLPLVYRELHELAGRTMRAERAGHTLQTTALVHEAYLKLVDQTQAQWRHRAHFYAVAAQLMRRLLIDHARARSALKRGGPAQYRPQPADVDQVAAPDRDALLLALDEALTALGEVDVQQARIVELRHFGGLTIEETATVLDISPATVKRDWAVAKAWLHREITRG